VGLSTAQIRALMSDGRLEFVEITPKRRAEMRWSEIDLEKRLWKGRLWLNDGSCVRLRPEYRDHVWSYDFIHCRPMTARCSGH